MSVPTTLAEHERLLIQAACDDVDASDAERTHGDWMERAKWRLNLERAVQAYRMAVAAASRSAA